MFFFKTVDIADNERALLFDRDRLQKVLGPGRHRLSTFGRKLKVEKFDITSVRFEHPKLKFLVRQYRAFLEDYVDCLLYTSPSPRDKRQSRMPSSA